MGRAPCCDKANVKRGPWSPEEDAALRSYLEKHGTGGNWITLPQKAGLKRCGKSCRLRWLNYLRPDIKHGKFTEEEDNIICSLYQSIGSRWSVIASQLPGRTDNDVKNYWNTKLKKRVMAGGQPSPSPATPPPATPPMLPPSTYILKTEPSYNYTTDYPSLSSLLYSELPPFAGNQARVNYSFSPSDDISAASSNVTMENSAGGDYYNNWQTVDGHLLDDYLASELSFSSSRDFLTILDSMDNIGEETSQLHCSSSSFWTAPTESKSHVLSYYRR